MQNYYTVVTRYVSIPEFARESFSPSLPILEFGINQIKLASRRSKKVIIKYFFDNTL